MIRTLFASTAIAALLATGALAQTTTPTPAPAEPAPAAAPAAPAAAEVARADGQLASNMIGENVYNGTGDNAENIGEVNDIVLDGTGMAKSVIIGVGGFLGIGEKNVAVEYKDISWAEKNGDRWIVVPATAEQLEALPDFDRTPYDPAKVVATSEPAAPATDTTATAPADPASPKTDTMAAAPADKPADTNAAATDPAATAAIDKGSLTELPAAEIRAEELIGTTVYGSDDANVGEIGDVVLTTDNKIDAVIIDVGGFLGVGEKEVAVGMDKLSFMRDKDGNRYLYTNFSKEQLDAAPAYDKSTWAEKRDQQRIMVQ